MFQREFEVKGKIKERGKALKAFPEEKLACVCIRRNMPIRRVIKQGLIGISHG